MQLTESRPIHKSAKFSSDVKSATALKELIDTAPLCNLCHARMHVNAMSIDHKEGIASGGLGDPDNAQMTHPYCNSIKN
ncbi:MAG: HNH endonuclease [Candidatus Binataceae bacterium]